MLKPATAPLLLWAVLATGAQAETRFDVVDLHVDLPYQVGYRGKALRSGTGQADVESLRAGNVRGVVLPLFVPRNVSPTGPRLMDLEASYLRVLAELQQGRELALPGCGETKGVRTWLSFEGAGPLADAPESLEAWVARGVRVVGLVHTEHNALASSSGDARAVSYGLTEAGKGLVRRAHSLGVAVDVSHASDRAVADVLAVARDTSGVVVATHSNARALCDHPRNLTDSQLRAIAATGGVVGINFHAPFVVRGRAAELADVVRQAQHLVRVAGEDHVAIGADFEGGIRPARGLSDASHFPDLARALSRAGLSDRQVRRLFSENALRVLCGSGN
ncbi:MAG: putative dipeptidase [Polyangiaceae bacterium]|jgi:membrane dipeptidase|nr:putative dipeptidase [Polyangiaceae bacterium]